MTTSKEKGTKVTSTYLINSCR